MVAPLTDLWCVPVTGVQGLNSLEYQICTAPEPFDTLVTGLVDPRASLLLTSEKAVLCKIYN